MFWLSSQSTDANVQLHGKRLIERRRLFQPSQVHFGWVFPVLCATPSFFDPPKSCDELLCFVKIYVSDVQVVYSILMYSFIWVVTRRSADRSIKSVWEVARRREEHSIKSVLEVTGRREERSTKSVLEVTRRREERSIKRYQERIRSYWKTWRV